MASSELLKLGIDVGSTTVKFVILNAQDEIVYSEYRRHHADIRATIAELFEEAAPKVGNETLNIAITGSGGLLLSQWLGLPFVQEVIASKTAIKHFLPDTDVVIELGGEDAKIIYFDWGIEQRMNGTCAGGTGAFIDQMAALLNTDALGLNEYAKDYTTLYPIASRCGVFAKTDIQPLLNEGASKSDIAASIFQAVVSQTIAGLACGRPIKGKVAFLGGPLFYLPELVKRFKETLELSDEDTYCPKDAHLFVASGAALCAPINETFNINEVSQALKDLGDIQGNEAPRIDPLFATEEEFEAFNARHAQSVVKQHNLASYTGPLYLGIDAGSTTMKAALIGEEGELLWSWYHNNEGDVLSTAVRLLRELYAQIPEGCRIEHATTTGYGEALLKMALRADSGEVETVSHLTGAEAFCPGVEFILDIGGQDMKCLRVKDGVIEHILLNEACSSGCGSFIEHFASSLGYTPQEFAALALSAEHPVDLGSRCTVFMNSRVKQAQKEGATVGDISAGLSYSVIKNALLKVIKLRDPKEMGEKIVVQGGTFLNDAVLRAFELVSKREAIRPNIAGLMGAYGAALLAKKRATGEGTTLLDEAGLDALNPKTRTTRCKGCSNACLLTISDFGEGRRFTTGNRCERGAGIKRTHKDLPNLFEYKNKRLFAYEPLAIEDAKYGTVGIPRALNMYENYPFWHTFFTKLGFRVELSSPSNQNTYLRGMESMPSESVCYPAKISHGHIEELIARDVDFIFMPSIRYERIEDKNAKNCFNCPIVQSYPTVINLNVENLKEKNVDFLCDFLPYHNKKALKKRLYEELAVKNIGRQDLSTITRAQVNAAVDAAYAEDKAFKREMNRKGEEALRYMEEHNVRGIVLAGRPYHIDPEINHAIPELIASYDLVVLTEDSVSHLMKPERPLRTFDQWMYHSRLYAAARYVCTRDDLDLIQLNSFGCGLDAVTTDQVQEILDNSDKIYTVLKIDQISNLGAVRIRVRSLLAALQNRALENKKRKEGTAAFNRVEFTKQMKDERYTILSPQMAPTHFEMLENIFNDNGYNFVLLPSVDHDAVEAGLRYVNNDACYPCILTTGQIMAALESGKYDLNHTAVIMSQTGGACRATNYIGLIRKALRDANLGHIPVLSLMLSPTGEGHEGFKISLSMLKNGVYAILLGDALMQAQLRTRPYEKVAGSADALYREILDDCKAQISTMNWRGYKRMMKRICEEFDALELVNDRMKPRVGVVGEILVKFHPTANNEVVKVIEQEGCEAVVPGLADFFMYCLRNMQNLNETLYEPWRNKMLGRLGINAIEFFRRPMRKYMNASKRLEPPTHIDTLVSYAKPVLSCCNCAGEGWLLTAEMIELIKSGAPNIVCTQPFGCLPNHVTGKGVIKELRSRYREANIVAVDYDPGASEVNQLNRIKLMISVAFENFKKGE